MKHMPRIHTKADWPNVDFTDYPENDDFPQLKPITIKMATFSAETIREREELEQGDKL